MMVRDELKSLAALAVSAREATERAKIRREARDAAIREAIEGGMSYTPIMKATGLSRAMVSHIATSGDVEVAV